MPKQTICRLPDVIARTGLSRSTIYGLISKGEFPMQVRLGPRSVGWVDGEIDRWISERISKARDERVNIKTIAESKGS
jgi:prophage regulatory protein